MISFNPNFRISNIIIAYCLTDYKEYQKIRDVLQAALANTVLSFHKELSLFALGRGLSVYTIVYVSPLVQQLSDVHVVCLGEEHELLPAQKENSIAIDALADGQSILLAEGVRAPKRPTEAPLSAGVRAQVTARYQLSAAQSRLPIYGWDREDNATIAYVRKEDEMETAVTRIRQSPLPTTEERASLSRLLNEWQLARGRYERSIAEGEQWQRDVGTLQAYIARTAPTFKARNESMVQTLKLARQAKQERCILCIAGLSISRERR